MSDDITLSDEHGTCEVARHEEGGTYCVGGTTRADLNVTFNYYRHFDFKSLNGRRAADVEPVLADAVRSLGTVRDPDYWASSTR